MASRQRCLISWKDHMQREGSLHTKHCQVSRRLSFFKDASLWTLDRLSSRVSYCLSNVNSAAPAPPRHLLNLSCTLSFSIHMSSSLLENKSQARLKSLFTASSGSPSFTRDSPTRIAPHRVCATKATCSGVKIPLSPAMRKPLLVTCHKHSTGVIQPAAMLDTSTMMSWFNRSAKHRKKIPKASAKPG